MKDVQHFSLLSIAVAEEIKIHQGIQEALKEQQKAILDKNAQVLMDVQVVLNAQLERAMQLKIKRERLFEVYQERVGCSKKMRMTVFFNEWADDLCDALKPSVQRLNSLLKNNRRLTQINRYLSHQLLSVAQELLQKFAPGQFLKMYTQKGGVKSAQPIHLNSVNFLA
jgi:hypothetical protein